jgi:hypothetical protein
MINGLQITGVGKASGLVDTQTGGPGAQRIGPNGHSEIVTTGNGTLQDVNVDADDAEVVVAALRQRKLPKWS